MTTHQRAALACRLAGISVAADGFWMASHQMWWWAVSELYAAVLLVLLGGRFHALHLDAQRTGRTRPTAGPGPLPCCSFGKHSGGQAHHHTCHHREVHHG